MDITKELLKQLKCCDCDCYLSRRPIFLKEDGAAVCGRCPKPDKLALRMVQFEILIEIMSFPCMYQKDGCPKVVPTLELKNHEKSCEYQKYICPVMSSAQCKWIGTVSELLEHCKSKHEDSFLNHPCSIKCDIQQSSIKSYITQIFNTLFLVHIKVCLTTHKILYSVDYIKKENHISDITFQLSVQRKEIVINKNGIVASFTCKASKENISVGYSINTLLEILEGFEDTTFTITIFAKGFENNPVKLQTPSPIISSETVPCKNKEKGCKYNDNYLRTLHHETLFCNFATWCCICKAYISSTLNEHYETRHDCDIYNTNAAINITRRDLSKTYYFIIEYENGIRFLFTMFINKENKCEILVNSSLISCELDNYEITLNYTKLESNDVVSVPLQFVRMKQMDWIGIAQNDTLSRYSNIWQVDIHKNNF